MRVALVSLAVVAVFSGPVPASAQTGGAPLTPFLGAWALSVGESEFRPNSNPIVRRTMTIDAVEGGGIHVMLETYNERYETSRSEYTAMFDGKDYPMKGSAIAEVSLKRVNATTIERSGKVQGKQVELTKLVLSADGKTLTMTTEGELPYSGPIYYRQVFKRSK